MHLSYDSCVTTLAVLAPTMDSAFDSTVTVTPNGNTQKAFSFSFSFVEQLNVKASLTKAIVDSQPEMTLTVSNLVAVSNGEVCQGASCALDHNLVIRFGQVGIAVCVAMCGCTHCFDLSFITLHGRSNLLRLLGA